MSSDSINRKGYMMNEELMEMIKESGIKYLIVDGEVITEFDSEYEDLFADDELKELNFDVD